MSVSPSVARTTTIAHKTGVFDVSLIAIAVLLYSVVRTFSADRAVDATTHAMHLVSIEQSLGIFHEARIQSFFISSDLAVKFFNAFYMYGHFPLIAAIGVWLFIFHRPQYVLFRNAILIAGALSLIAYNFFPTAPPRLMPWPYGMVDTLGAFSRVNYESGGAFINDYAAMPSLHVGFNVLIAMALIASTRNRFIWAIGGLLPVLMALTVVVTGNHFILDIFAGYVVALVGLALALLWRRHGPRLGSMVTETRQEARAPA